MKTLIITADERKTLRQALDAAVEGLPHIEALRVAARTAQRRLDGKYVLRYPSVGETSLRVAVGQCARQPGPRAARAAAFLARFPLPRPHSSWDDARADARLIPGTPLSTWDALLLGTSATGLREAATLWPADYRQQIIAAADTLRDACCDGALAEPEIYAERLRDAPTDHLAAAASMLVGVEISSHPGDLPAAARRLAEYAEQRAIKEKN